MKLCVAPALIMASLMTAPATAAGAPPVPVAPYAFAGSGIGVLREMPQSTPQMRLSFAPIVERTAPAVVNVYSRRVVRERVNPFFDDEFLRMFGGPEASGLTRERVQQSLGSGVIVRGDGIVVTNNHVIEGGQKLTIALADRREFEAEVVLADAHSDLAVLRIHPGSRPLPTIAFGNSDDAKVGDLVLAIGDPFGIGQTVTNGIVSALARTQVGISDYRFFIQTDAAINPGNSGGALVTLDGNLVGINTAIYSRSGGSIGVGFAIPSNMVRLVVDQALSNGKVTRPWFGATTQVITPAIAESLGLARPQGVVIASVRAQSPAEQAGLHAGDVIISINGFAVEDPEAVRYRVAMQKLDATIPVEALTKGVKRAVNVHLSAPPENPPRDETLLKGQQPLSGATVVNLSPAVNEAYNLDPRMEGVMIMATAPGSIAQRYGLGRGDLVLAVNGAETRTVDALERALASANRHWVLRMQHDGRVVDFEVRN